MARRTFGNTWWGAAWLDALEQRALVNPNRLPRGRTYARQDRVRETELSPGLLHAAVWGTDRYATQLSVRVLTDAEWDHVIDTIMGQASNAAALLAGEVPHAIGDLVLPARGDLGPGCSCPDSVETCKHVAALCYVAADLFDDDPFALLALRGRGRDEVLGEVRRRRAEALGGGVAETSNLPRGADRGVSGAAAYKAAAARAVAVEAGTAERQVGPRRVPMAPIRSADYRLSVNPPVDAGIDNMALRELVGDAADRAWRMLAFGEPSGLAASVGDDVVRRAARASEVQRPAIAKATGLDPVELESAARAWQAGGRAGHRANRDRWDASPEKLAPGVVALGDKTDEGAKDAGHAVKTRGNRVSLGSLQLRLAEDGQWWRFASDDELGWVLVAGPANDPADLLD